MGSRGFLLAWLVGESIIIYRTVKVYRRPPMPGELLASSGLFVMLALLGEAEKARTLALTLAWGLDLAALLNLFGTGIVGQAIAGPSIKPLPGGTSQVPAGTTLV